MRWSASGKSPLYPDPVILRIGRAPYKRGHRSIRTFKTVTLPLAHIPPEVARPFAVDMQAHCAEQNDIRYDRRRHELRLSEVNGVV